MILTGPEIEAAVKRGEINISNYDEKQLNDVSYDVRLGNKVAVYKAQAAPSVWSKTKDSAHQRLRMVEKCADPAPLDAAVNNELWEFELQHGDPVFLQPGLGYLMHTEEIICTNHYVPIIDGKSSIGRLFVSVHQTAGYGEPGFDGQWTLEVVAQSPVVLYVGMKVGQMRFHVPRGDVRRYAGHYQGDGARGPVGSRAHLQIAADIRDKRLPPRTDSA